uniref:Uncharacterized protein n=1 Tax=Aureoumbra lagunensis TaxID=44058 RepID=A0A7S3NHR8_9STRA
MMSSLLLHSGCSEKNLLLEGLEKLLKESKDRKREEYLKRYKKEIEVGIREFASVEEMYYAIYEEWLLVSRYMRWTQKKRACCFWFKSTEPRPLLIAECERNGLYITQNCTRYQLAAIALSKHNTKSSIVVPKFCRKHQKHFKASIHANQRHDDFGRTIIHMSGFFFQDKSSQSNPNDDKVEQEHFFLKGIWDDLPFNSFRHKRKKQDSDENNKNEELEEDTHKKKLGKLNDNIQNPRVFQDQGFFYSLVSLGGDDPSKDCSMTNYIHKVIQQNTITTWSGFFHSDSNIIQESNLLLQFQVCSSESNKYDIRGQGHNSFGPFIMTGSLSLLHRCVTLERIYCHESEHIFRPFLQPNGLFYTKQQLEEPKASPDDFCSGIEGDCSNERYCSSTHSLLRTPDKSSTKKKKNIILSSTGMSENSS